MENKTFRVYYRDGNQKLYGAENMYNLLSYLCFIIDYPSSDIYKIEEVEEDTP